MKPKMNDLIRRKDVMAALEEVFDDYKMSWGEQYGGFASAVPNAIGNIPTAYNEKSVVEQLKQLSIGTVLCDKCEYREKCDDIQEKYNPDDDTDLCTMVAKSLAIEIVKGGAV